MTRPKQINYGIKIGNSYWAFNENRRVYRQDPKTGRTDYNSGAPIFSEHFERITVTGETPRSWIVGHNSYARKIPKSNPFYPGNNFYTDQMKDDAIWLNVHRHAIIHRLNYSTDASMMRKVAELIGYEVKK